MHNEGSRTLRDLGAVEPMSMITRKDQEHLPDCFPQAVFRGEFHGEFVVAMRRPQRLQEEVYEDLNALCVCTELLETCSEP